jgi:hypothetical protein
VTAEKTSGNGDKGCEALIPLYGGVVEDLYYCRQTGYPALSAEDVLKDPESVALALASMQKDRDLLHWYMGQAFIILSRLVDLHRDSASWLQVEAEMNQLARLSETLVIACGPQLGFPAKKE